MGATAHSGAGIGEKPKDPKLRSGAIMMSRTIVMVHGAFVGGWAFDKLRSHFEALGFRCHVPTLRHHAWHDDNTAHPALGTTSIRDYTDDLSALIERLDEPPILMGHSLGGLLAQILASRHNVAAAILLAPSPPWGMLPTSPFEFLSAHALFLTGPFWQQAIYPDANLAGRFTFNRLPAAERAELISRMVPESGRATFELLHWAHDLHKSTHVRSRDVRCPVLCIAGMRDEVNRPAVVKRIAGRYRPRSQFMALSDMSHWLLTEPGWQDMATLMHGWLRVALAPNVMAAD